jgi:hypothetical protein
MRADVRWGATLATLAAVLAPRPAPAQVSSSADYPLAARCDVPEPRPAECARLSRLSRPQPIAASVHNHDGFFLRGGLGLSAYRSHLPGVNESTLGFGAEVLLGGTPWPGVVVGGGFIGEGLSSPDHPMVAYAAFTQWYPDSREGFHLQALAAFAIVDDQPRTLGPLGALGIGYDVFVGDQTSLGVFARAGYAEGFGDGFHVSAPFASVQGSFTWH